MRVNPEMADTCPDVLVLELTEDLEQLGDVQVFNLRFRHSVFYWGAGDVENCTFKVKCSTKTLQDYLRGERDPRIISTDPDVQYTGQDEQFQQFLSCFQLD